ncbi:hypothetical protein LXD69_07525 [Flavobacterium sediminilitoris]|uniref:Uncharacterized protein n=1 Tax=Flavobacterium sediminilitoris TaxID=2024526 RepID=A0ABY4HRY3_9FLAO|nr:MULTISPECIES: hypothetical protein [Flavobacterium]UOX35361.1 hypothetical protein LXD69_07525 [Flavobacterium sediminilitoris]
MSGFSLTLIVCNNKITRQSNFFSDLNFNKEIVSYSLLNYEFSIKQEVKINGKEVYIHDSFYIEYNNEIENYGYPEQFWKEVVNRIENPICSISISSMSRDYASFYVVLKHIEQLLLESYHFYLITNNLNIESLKPFENSNDLLKLNDSYYLISERIIDYLVQKELFDFIEY